MPEIKGTSARMRNGLRSSLTTSTAKRWPMPRAATRRESSNARCCLPPPKDIDIDIDPGSNIQQPTPAAAPAAAAGDQLPLQIQQQQLLDTTTSASAGTSGVGVYYHHRLKTQEKAVTANREFWARCKREFADRSIVSEELADAMTAIGRHNASKRRKTATSTSQMLMSANAAECQGHDALLPTAQLRPEQICGRCGCKGSMHPRRQILRLDKLMRTNGADIERLLDGEPGSISKRTCKSRFSNVVLLEFRCCDILS